MEVFHENKLTLLLFVCQIIKQPQMGFFVIPWEKFRKIPVLEMCYGNFCAETGESHVIFAFRIRNSRRTIRAIQFCILTAWKFWFLSWATIIAWNCIRTVKRRYRLSSGTSNCAETVIEGHEFNWANRKSLHTSGFDNLQTKGQFLGQK